MVWRTVAVIWAIADFRLVICPLATSRRSERVLIEVIGEQERGDYALIAAISGAMPMMFMTRVRL